MGLNRNKCDSVGGRGEGNGCNRQNKRLYNGHRDRGSVFAWKDLFARDKLASNDLERLNIRTPTERLYSNPLPLGGCVILSHRSFRRSVGVLVLTVVLTPDPILTRARNINPILGEKGCATWTNAPTHWHPLLKPVGVYNTMVGVYSLPHS
jgi:hypothetical protein